MKTCPRCGLEKPLTAFWRSKRNKDGYHSICKECDRAKHTRYNQTHKTSVYAQQRAWALSHPEHIFDQHLRKHYGISFKDYMVLFEAQGGVCAICRQPETARNPRTGKPKNLSVDHDHFTGIIRGLLCTRCNQAIGFFEENAERMVHAMEYLEKAVSQHKIVQLELFKEALPTMHQAAVSMMDTVYSKRGKLTQQ